MAPFHVTVAADTNNDRPFLASIDPITTNVNTPVNFYIPATDVEGDAKYYAGLVSPSNDNLAITVNSSTGQVTLTRATVFPASSASRSGWKRQTPPPAILWLGHPVRARLY